MRPSPPPDAPRADAREPILVIGAHRSGTSALARVLESLGVFVGAKLDPNHEPWFFLRLNEWLLAQCGGRWDHPAVIDDLLADAATRSLARDYLAFALRTPRAIGFLGTARYLRRRGIDRLVEPWGFKDPRTTYTLPLWLDLFPTARVVHIHRHGVDVADSLCRRHRAHLERSRRGFDRNKPLLALLRKRAGFGESARCATLEGAFSLWEDYVTRARTHVAGLGERAREVAYEDLAGAPRETIAALAAFCGLLPGDEAIDRAAALMSSDRVAAHATDARLAEFARSVESRVRAVRATTAGAIQSIERRPNHASTP